jgi:hypothetical protein
MFCAKIARRSFHLAGHQSVTLNLQRRLASSSSSLPTAIFVDLDNVAPLTHGRSDAQDFAQPLREFAEKAGTLNVFWAFANVATQTYVTEDERERRDAFEQEYIEWDNETQLAQTGYDNDGILRCGVCGSKMKLNKKDKARGSTMEEKLDKHMRMLHDREQEKRTNRLKQLKGKKKRQRFMGENKVKYEKYKAAQVGLFRNPATRSKKPNIKRKTNDLFRVLREQKIRCFSVKDVDSSLEKEARRWMDRLCSETHVMVDDEARACLVVVSEDSDFVKLLNDARSKNILAVSVTPTKVKQTFKLVKASDLVLTRAGPTVDLGDEFGTLIGKANTYKGVELLMAMGGNHKVDFNSWEKESMTFEGSPINDILYEDDMDEEEYAESEFDDDYFDEEDYVDEEDLDDRR